MRGIDHAARERGLHLLVSSYHGNPAEQGAALRAMRGRVDGLLVMSPFVGDAGMVRDTLSPGMPAVLMNSSVAEADLRAVSVDNYAGAREMVRHLVAAGHRRIAFIAGPGNNFDASERLRGYRDELAASLPGTQAWILDGDFHEASGHREGGELLSSAERPDAVFAANDMMALGCLFALNHAGVQAPRDIAIAGFDDIPLARYVHPSLTTMRVDIAELGNRSLRALLESMASPADPGDGMDQGEPLVPMLMVRDSSVAGVGGSKARVSATAVKA